MNSSPTGHSPKLPAHDASREDLRMISNPVPWPGGARCAIAITWDVDCESSMHWYNQVTADTLIATHTLVRYDLLALPRLIEAFRSREMRQTFFFPGWCIEKHTRHVEALLQEGHEIGLHGYLHERSNELSREDERYWFNRAVEAFIEHVGHAPRGWRAPSFAFSKHSLDLLLEHGFAYNSSLMGDDVPYAIENDAGGLLELPVDWTLDDWPPYVHNRDFRFMMPISAPQRAIEVFRSEFDANWRHGGLVVTVWHPFVSGRLARLDAALDLIDEMRDRGGIWFATLGEIARHVDELVRSGAWTPRRERIPLYRSPLPEFSRDPRH